MTLIQRTTCRTQELRAMALSSGFGIVLTFFFLFRVFEANDTALPPKFFNVLDYGAVADGKTDNSEVNLGN